MLTEAEKKKLLRAIVVLVLLWAAVDTAESASKATDSDPAGRSLMKDPS